MTGFIENAGNSLKYGFSTAASHPLRWVGLTIVLIIPIIFFFGFGLLLKVFRNEEPNFENPGRCFVQGLLVFIIWLIYNIIPVGVYFLLQPLGIIGMVIGAVVALLFELVAIPAIINYARTQKFGGAFAFSSIFGMIRSVTWLRYLLSYLVYLVIALIIGAIFGVIKVIPAVGNPLVFIIGLIVTVPLALFSVKYWQNLFS